MKIYIDEMSDGLSEQISNNRTIAFNCALKPIEKPSEVSLKKAYAAMGDNQNIDLFYVSSVLASIGINSNDDVFTKEELFNARATPVHKQFNFQHDEKDIFGCIIDSIAVNIDGNQVDSFEEIQDVITQSVLWTKWADPELQGRMNDIIDGIDNNQWFVSMEALFSEFDYLLTKGDEQKYISRSNETAFLTKYLRSFGGDGLYDGFLVNRVLKNFIFSGKGLVKNPANNRSIILTKAENNRMADSNVLETQVIDLKSELAKASDQIDKMTKEQANLVTVKITNLQEANTVLQKQVDDLKSLAESVKADAVVAANTHKDAIKVLEDAKASLEKEKEEMVTAQAVAKRVADLVAVNVDPDKAVDVVKTWASATDEQFITLVKLYSKENVAEPEVENENQDFDLDEFKADANKTDVNLNDQIDPVDVLNKALASEISKALLTNSGE